MASSQVEIVSSSPFGCVLRKQTRKDRYREINVRAVLDLDTNLKDLVRDHINGCISQNHITHVAMTKEHGIIGNRRNFPLLNKNHTTNNIFDNAMFTKNLGASSLVQIWEARLNKSFSIINSNQFQSQSTDFDSSSNENDTSPMEEPSKVDPFDEKINKETNNEDTLIEWDTSIVSPCDSTGEREKVRIEDIIKKLKNGREDVDGHEHSNNANSQSRDQGQAEQRCFLQAVNTPRLRGRQAFKDLLMRIERDKNRELDSLLERKLVSKFSQRGRIQSMLRLRCLQRCLTIQDKCRPQAPKSHLTRFSYLSKPKGKFSTCDVHNDSATSRCLNKDHVLNNSTHLDKNSTSKQQNEDTHCQKESIARHQSIPPVNRFTTYINENIFEQTKLPSYAMQQKETSLEARCLDSQETVKTVSSFNANTRNEIAQEQGKHQQHLSLGLQGTKETTSSLNSSIENEIGQEQEQHIDDQQRLRLDSEEIMEKTTSYNDKDVDEISEEPEDQSTQYSDQTNYDWFSNIAQNEIAQEQGNHHQHLSLGLQGTKETTSSLNSSTENEIGQEQEQHIDDQQRLRLDSEEIMEKATSYNDRDDDDDDEISEELEDHSTQYSDQTNYDWFSNIARPKSYWEDLRKAWYHEVLNTTQKNEEIRQLVERGTVSTFLTSAFRERMDQLMISRVQIMQEDEAASKEEVDYEDRMVQVKSYLQRHLHEVDGQGEEEVEEEKEEEEEEEEEMSIISHQLHEETDASQARSSSPISPTSLEMELICDLRGHIEQLQREMVELRKSIMSYMNMQMNSQQSSFNEKLLHSGMMEENKSTESATLPWKRSCCICLEMQVDSLLYRCGHMCTCLKCAHELQWGNGKCPKCGAPILDVVPTKWT